jgi:hypothetical protein
MWLIRVAWLRSSHNESAAPGTWLGPAKLPLDVLTSSRGSLAALSSLWIGAGAVGLGFRSAGPSSSVCARGGSGATLTCARRFGPRGVGRQAAAWRVIVSHATARAGSVLIAGAALLLVAPCERKSRADYQDRFFHTVSFVVVSTFDVVSVDLKLDVGLRTTTR